MFSLLCGELIFFHLFSSLHRVLSRLLCLSSLSFFTSECMHIICQFSSLYTREKFVSICAHNFFSDFKTLVKVCNMLSSVNSTLYISSTSLCQLCHQQLGGSVSKSDSRFPVISAFRDIMLLHPRLIVQSVERYPISI